MQNAVFQLATTSYSFIFVLCKYLISCLGVSDFLYVGGRGAAEGWGKLSFLNKFLCLAVFFSPLTKNK